MTAPPAVAARPAGPDDLPVVAALYEQAAAELAAERGGSLAAAANGLLRPIEETARSLIASGGLVELGTLDEVPVGAVVAHRRELVDGRVIASVDFLYVEPAARAVGVGETLLERVLAWADGTGCAGVDALALPGMREAKNFFERAGFAARLLVMHRPPRA